MIKQLAFLFFLSDTILNRQLFTVNKMFYQLFLFVYICLIHRNNLNLSEVYGAKRTGKSFKKGRAKTAFK